MQMDIRHWFIKYAWAVNLVLLAGVAYICARTANQYLANKLISVTPEKGVTINSRLNKGRQYQPPIKAIISRDLFKAAEGPLDLPVVNIDGDTTELKKTNLRLKLLGIAYNIEEGIATIQSLTDQKIGVYLVGDTVTEDSSVHSMKIDQVILARASGVHEVLSLEKEESLKKSKANWNMLTPEERAKQLRGKKEARDKSRPSKLRGPRGPDLSGKIKEVSENEFVIQRDAIDEALSNLNSIITQARVIPNFVGKSGDRKLEGFRIYRIKPNSIFQYLGLKNGDVIKSINGEKMDSVEKGLQLLQALRSESKFSMNVERQKTPIELSYEVE